MTKAGEKNQLGSGQGRSRKTSEEATKYNNLEERVELTEINEWI